MSKIVGIGANVYDTLVELEAFPKEDTKMRAKRTVPAGGGPVGTGLVAAAKLGAACAYIGTVARDAAGEYLMRDFERYGVSTEYVKREEGTSFTSFVLLSQENATRTVVFDKGTMAPLSLSAKQKGLIRSADILMVDGNEMAAACEAAAIAKESGTSVLYDAGGLYPNVEKLLPYADYLIPSEEFALSVTGTRSLEAAAKALYEMYSPKLVVITAGSTGGIRFDGSVLIYYPAYPVEAVDSNGAGDVFHGAFAYALTCGMKAEQCCRFASATSAIKCTRVGARDGVPSYHEVIEFIKERGTGEFEEIME